MVDPAGFAGRAFGRLIGCALLMSCCGCGDASPKASGAGAASSRPQFVVGHNEIVPAEWMTDPKWLVDVTRETDLDKLCRVRQLVIEELARYGDSPSAQVPLVAVCKRLKVGEFLIAGSFTKSSLWISLGNGQIESFSDSYLRETVHHEYAGHLIARYELAVPVRVELWNKQLPENFAYIGSPYDLAATGINLASFSNDLWKEGFLEEYAKASLFKDFCVCWQWLYSSPDDVMRAIKMSDRIRIKMWLVVDWISRWNRPALNGVRPDLLEMIEATRSVPRR
jgi:hypothetical protein